MGILDRCKILKVSHCKRNGKKLRMLRYIGSERLDYKKKIGSEMHTAFEAKQIRFCFILLREPRNISLSRSMVQIGR